MFKRFGLFDCSALILDKNISIKIKNSNFLTHILQEHKFRDKKAPAEWKISRIKLCWVKARWVKGGRNGSIVISWCASVLKGM
jgi:hypothetical protein